MCWWSRHTLSELASSVAATLLIWIRLVDAGTDGKEVVVGKMPPLIVDSAVSASLGRI